MQRQISQLVMLLAGMGACHSYAQDQFDQLCAGCHGDQANGGKGSSLLGPLKHGDDHAAILRAIRDGYPELGMPTFQHLAEGDLHILVVRIQERRADGPKPAPVQPLDQQLVRRSECHPYRIEALVSDGLEVPWSFDFLPDGRIILTERAGRVRFIENGKLVPAPLEGVPPRGRKG